MLNQRLNYIWAPYLNFLSDEDSFDPWTPNETLARSLKRNAGYFKTRERSALWFTKTFPVNFCSGKNFWATNSAYLKAFPLVLKTA